MNQKIAVIYHADCLDGMGGAYAAWKKFGDAAEYIPCRHGDPVPQNLEGREIYMIDFSYPKEALLAIESGAASLTILDHHMGAREAVESVKNHIFDNDRSGASIAWTYFHRETPLPRLLAYVEDNDLWRKTLPDTDAVSAYTSTLPFTFDAWDRAVTAFDDDTTFAQIVVKGKNYLEYTNHALEILERDAEEVEFEGYRVLCVNVPRLLRSELGNRLAKKTSTLCHCLVQLPGPEPLLAARKRRR